MPVTRFAPSPTGYLHLGHAYSALTAFRAATRGSFLVRIEDIDPVRCKPEYTAAILEDLRWLGLRWQEPVRLQSEHMDDYASALEVLKDKRLVYPCFCTRREIRQEAANAAHAPHAEDEDAVIYPGTCRGLSEGQRAELFAKRGAANWRLDIEKAMRQTGPLDFRDLDRGLTKVDAGLFGDVVLARKDIPASYHLSVVVDDHLQGVSLVTRGDDLFPSTHIHRVLQALLGYHSPVYRHHRLIRDPDGRRFAKRDRAATLKCLREIGTTPAAIRKQLGF